MSKESTATLVADAAASQPRGVAVSGKSMTVVLLLVLLVSGLLFYWVTTAYATYNAARRQTDQSWRNVAALLETRYRTVDSAVAAVGEETTPAAKIDPKIVPQWRAARDAFTGTALTAHQVEAASELEKLIGQLPEPLAQSLAASEELRGAVADYQSAIETQHHVGNTPGSRLLKSMLVLRDPLEFQIARQ